MPARIFLGLQAIILFLMDFSVSFSRTIWLEQPRLLRAALLGRLNSKPCTGVCKPPWAYCARSEH